MNDRNVNHGPCRVTKKLLTLRNTKARRMNQNGVGIGGNSASPNNNAEPEEQILTNGIRKLCTFKFPPGRQLVVEIGGEIRGHSGIQDKGIIDNCNFHCESERFLPGHCLHIQGLLSAHFNSRSAHEPHQV